MGALDSGTSFFYDGLLAHANMVDVYRDNDYLSAEYDNQSSSTWFSNDGWNAVSGTISITENVVNTNYTSLNPTIGLTGLISITEQVVNTNYTSLNPTIDLTGLVSVTKT